MRLSVIIPCYNEARTIEQIVASAKAHDYGVRALIHGLVQSDLFQRK